MAFSALSIEKVPMRLAMKFGVSFRADDAFAEALIAKFGEGVEHVGVSAWAGDQFDELHVARRVEEVRAGEVLLKIGRAACGDFVHGDAGGVGGDEGAGAADGFEAGEQGALDVEIFGDGFEDPVSFGAKGEVVGEVAGRDETRGFGREEGCGARFFRGVESGRDNATTDLWRIESEVFLLFLRREGRGSYVEQEARQAGVGEVRGDAGAHGTGAEHGYFFDATLHVGENLFELRLKFRGYKSGTESTT